MATLSRVTLPRADELRPARRRGSGGRTYIGPKVQVNVPGEHYDAVLRGMEECGLSDEQYPDMLREVFAAGLQALGLIRDYE